eukprot:5998895-Pleurochrysis_carterae.AAC.1
MSTAAALARLPASPAFIFSAPSFAVVPGSSLPPVRGPTSTRLVSCSLAPAPPPPAAAPPACALAARSTCTTLLAAAGHPI